MSSYPSGNRARMNELRENLKVLSIIVNAMKTCSPTFRIVVEDATKQNVAALSECTKKLMEEE